MRKIAILLIALMVISVSVLSGCSDRGSEDTGGNFITPKSNIQVVSKIARNGYSGIDYCAFIDIVVQNYGNAGGSAEVWCELKQDTNTAEKRQSVYLNSGESQSVTLTFCELSFWSGSEYTYRVWVE